MQIKITISSNGVDVLSRNVETVEFTISKGSLFESELEITLGKASKDLKFVVMML